MSDCILNKSVVSLDEFNTYSNNFSDTEGDVKLKVNLLNSAQSVVEEWLGYSLASCHHKEIHIGTNQKIIYLDAMPITTVWSVTIGDKVLEPVSHGISSVTLPCIARNGEEIVVEYDSGWQEVPDLIKTTILRIATLLLTESNGNIGLTSKSFPDNTRNFLNYTNFSKYLEPLALYRIFKM